LRRWTSAEVAAAEWIEAAKGVSGSARDDALEALAVTLGTDIPSDAYSGEVLSWADIREMAGLGIEFGSHTLTHPILTQLPVDQVTRELTESRRRLEDELGSDIRSLAYPNGTVRDFSPEIERLCAEAGYEAVFSLVPGPARRREALSNPMAIRRIAFYLPDTGRRWRAKVAGGGRLRADLS
jgi:hypothetical protein